MKKFIKLTSLLLVAALIFALAACSGTKAKNFKEWFSDEFAPAFEAFAQTEYAKEKLPMPSLTLIIGSAERLNSVLGFINEEKQPEDAEIKAEGNVYTYKSDEYKYIVELNEKNSALRITSEIEFLGEKRTEFIVTLREYKNEYYIQYFSPDFENYFEIRFTSENGKVMRESISDIPFSIFEEDKIPPKFAEER